MLSHIAPLCSSGQFSVLHSGWIGSSCILILICSVLCSHPSCFLFFSLPPPPPARNWLVADKSGGYSPRGLQRLQDKPSWFAVSYCIHPAFPPILAFKEQTASSSLLWILECQFAYSLRFPLQQCDMSFVLLFSLPVLTGHWNCPVPPAGKRGLPKCLASLFVRQGSSVTELTCSN